MIKKFAPVLMEIKISKILEGEIGVFAARDLKKGTIVGDVKLMPEEYFISWDCFDKIDNTTQHIIMKYCIGSPEGFYAPPNINYIPISWHFNHSCSGNTGFDKKGNFVTIRDVLNGEELCYDYALAESNPNFRMKCKCKSTNCRKMITGNDWKNKIFSKKNYNHMLPDLKKHL